MKTLIVYFSHTGNNRVLAKHLAQGFQCETCAIREKGRRSGLTIFMDMLFSRQSKIKPIDKNISLYDHVIFAAPIWGSKVANPLLTYILQHKESIGHFSFISLCGNSGQEQRQKLENQLTRACGKTPGQVVQLNVVDLLPEDKKADVKAMLRYRVEESKLERYTDSINEFIGQIKT